MLSTFDSRFHRSKTTVVDNLTPGPRRQGHPCWNGKAVTDETDRAIAKKERHARAMGAGGRLGVENASRIRARGSGMAHQQGNLGAEVARRLGEWIQRARGPTNPRAVRQLRGAVPDKQGVA